MCLPPPGPTLQNAGQNKVKANPISDMNQIRNAQHNRKRENDI